MRRRLAAQETQHVLGPKGQGRVLQQRRVQIGQVLPTPKEHIGALVQRLLRLLEIIKLLEEPHNKRVKTRQFVSVRPAKTVGDIGNGRVSQTRHVTSASLFLMSARAGEANDRQGTVAAAKLHFL